MTPLELVADKIGAPRNGMVRCPAHDDGSASLSVKEADDGKVLLNCHAGCTAEQVATAAGLAMKDLFPAKPTTDAKRRIANTYDYVDEAGELLFQSVRYDPKAFAQRRPDGRGGWTPSLGDIRIVPYRLPDAIEAVAAGRRVFIAEGEKDVDALVKAGEAATCNPMGAKSWRRVSDVAAKVLCGAEVVVVADKDEAGHRWAREVCRTLLPVAASLTICEASTGKDAADHLGAGHLVDDFDVIVESTPGIFEPDWSAVEAWLNEVDVAASTPPTNVDPTTGQIDEALDDAFWTARPLLAHIRQAAHARATSASALLGDVLARIAMLTPPTIGLPAVVGSRATLDLIVAPVGPSGAGKSTSNDLGRELLPTNRADIRDGYLLGSGEGIAEAFLGPPEKVEEPDGTKRTIRRQIYAAMYAVADEGQVVFELGGRNGNVLLPQLRSAWSGKTIGQENATAETWRRVEGGRYRFAASIALQPRWAARALADTDGLAQRLLFLSATDPTIPDEAPEWPGPIDWTPPAGATYGADLTIDDAIADEIRSRRLARGRGQAIGDELDAQADLLREKVAGLLAVAENRRQIEPGDWKLAGRILEHSNRVRSSARAWASHEAAEEQQRRIAHHVRRESAVADSAEHRALIAGAKAIGRKVRREGTMKRSALARAVAGKHRDHASVDDMIAHAVAHDWIVDDGDTVTPGGSQPS